MRSPSSGLLLLLVLLLAAVYVLRIDGTPLDDDLRSVNEFLQKTSGASSRFANFSSSSSSPCSSLNNELSSGVKIQCSGYGDAVRISGLLLESLGLSGVYPSNTLGKLSALSHLSVFNNSLSGALPPELWRLSQLSYLSLSRNLFSRSLPPQLSSLSKLTRLDLSYNRLSGPLPPQLGQLFNLRFLFLTSNSFSSPLPRFSLPSLLSLDLSSNNLSQAFPAHQLSALSSLRDLNFSHNRLYGPLLNGLSSMPSLSLLDLSGNNLSGPVSSLRGLRALTFVDLGDNAFEGDVSALVGGLPVSLVLLDLSSNKFTGDPSLNLSRFSTLVHLGLAGNDFLPSSCEWVDGFKHLEFLNLSRSHVVGTIPQSIGSLTNLTEIDVSYNELNGSVPSSFAKLRLVTYLDLSSNNLTGDLTVLASLASLRYLNLSYNEGTGCAPPALRNKFGPDSFKGLCEPSAVAIIQNQRSYMKKSKKHLATILGTIAGSILVMCGLLATGLLCKKKATLVSKKAPVEERYVSGPFSFETDSGMWLANVKNPSSVPVVIFEKPLLNLTFADLLQATSNFGKESQLTEGGFGPVYRAILPSGLDVKIKVLIEGRILSDQEAAAEFGVLSKIKHPNLVPLVGYCVVGDERLVIYEHMENGGLHRWLHELPVGTHLDDWSRDLWEPVEEEIPGCSEELILWTRRHSIALGIARALAFLHHGHSPPMVHRDVKASNVMLDAEFEPHLANTGLVGLLAASDEGLFAGSTPGYAPPEYRQPGGKVSPRGDVYSFGIVLLELVTGKRPVGDSYQEGYTGNLVGWVRFLMKEKRGQRAIDPRISNRGPISEMLEALRIGYLCTAESPSKRPTMQQIVGLLKDLEPHGTSP